MSKVEIISEIGINHSGNMNVAKELIRAARWAGADAVKFQAYSVPDLFPDKKIVVNGRNWYDEVLQTQLTRQQVFELAEYARIYNLEFLCSVFDLERLQWLEEIKVIRHKIATRVNRNRELIDAIVATGKPFFISCQQRSDIDFIESSNASYLYCIPHYPTELKEFWFRRINFPNEFVGLSDHSVGIEASMIAIARGAQVIEKHFTLNKFDQSGPDHIVSAEPEDLMHLVKFARKFEQAIGYKSDR